MIPKALTAKMVLTRWMVHLTRMCVCHLYESSACNFDESKHMRPLQLSFLNEFIAVILLDLFSDGKFYSCSLSIRWHWTTTLRYEFVTCFLLGISTCPYDFLCVYYWRFFSYSALTMLAVYVFLHRYASNNLGVKSVKYVKN